MLLGQAAPLPQFFFVHFGADRHQARVVGELIDKDVAVFRLAEENFRLDVGEDKVHQTFAVAVIVGFQIGHPGNHQPIIAGFINAQRRIAGFLDQILPPGLGVGAEHLAPERQPGFPDVGGHPLAQDAGALLLFFPLQFLDELLQHQFHHFHVEGLHQVFAGVQFEGGGSVPEAFVAGQQQKLALEVVFPVPTQQVQAGFLGHFNVADHNIHRLPGKDFLGGGGILGGVHPVNAQLVPVDAVAQIVQNDGIIVYQ